jgi:hypothetical protein
MARLARIPIQLQAGPDPRRRLKQEANTEAAHEQGSALGSLPQNDNNIRFVWFGRAVNFSGKL